MLSSRFSALLNGLSRPSERRLLSSLLAGLSCSTEDGEAVSNPTTLRFPAVLTGGSMMLK
jgi:hypothetical protein